MNGPVLSDQDLHQNVVFSTQHSAEIVPIAGIISTPKTIAAKDCSFVNFADLFFREIVS